MNVSELSAGLNVYDFVSPTVSAKFYGKNLIVYDRFEKRFFTVNIVDVLAA